MKQSKLIKLFAILLFVLISNSVSFAQFGGGNGTQAAPYEIYTIEHLMALSDSVENSPANDSVTDYNWSRGKYFILKNDINDSVRFTIGFMHKYYITDYVSSFQGNFNGNNKQITLAIDGKQKLIDGVWTNVINHIGLFSFIYLADVYNLNVTGYVKGEYYIGGLCGIAIESSISNCVNRCNVENYTYTEYPMGTIGGICGGIGSVGDKDSISDCVNYGNVKGYGAEVGGIAGWMGEVVATNCINYGNITCSQYFAAGICGVAYGVSWHVYLSNCHNYGDVSGEEAVGGIIGCLAADIFDSRSTNISYCTNSGTITATTAAGGIAGHVHIRFGISHCVNNGTVRGDSTVGGIASGHTISIQDTSGFVTNCHNAGFVIGRKAVGGIQGCCWGGEISNSLNTGVVIGNTNTGGIAGETNNTAVIKNCYYDKQMCIHGGIAEKDIAGQAEGYLTKELIGNNLLGKLNRAWTFNNPNLYPTLEDIRNDSVAFVASSPVYLYDSDVADFDRQNRVSEDFKVNLENDVKWNRVIGNVDIVNEDGVLRTNGNDTLVCSIGIYKKLVPINIELSPNYNVKFTIWATEHKQVSPTETNYSIPIYIKADATTLQEVTIKKLIIEIDNRIFYAKYSDNGTLASKNQNEITIENIIIPALNAGEEVVLFNLIGDVLLGTVDSSEIIINQNIELAGDFNGSPEVTNGSITLDICREGSDRFIEVADKSPSLTIKNNPVEDILEVECNILESGRYVLEVVDMAGRSVKVEEFVAGGVENQFYFTLSTENWSVGNYLLVLNTPVGKYSAVFVVKM